MENFSLAYPATPFIVHQAWGIYNPAYIQFGFSKHNGIDFEIGKDKLLYAPCDMTLFLKEFQPNGGGNMTRFVTDEVICEGVPCRVVIVFMHLDKLPDEPIGTKFHRGQVCGVPDNTGFSTGPHTHMSTYRIGKNDERLDTDKETNYSFDPAKYWTGQYANAGFYHVYAKNLDVGMSGQEVIYLQLALQLLGFFPKEQACTGYYGPITKEAVKRFQITKGIISSPFSWGAGTFGPKTRTAMNELMPIKYGS